MGRSPSIRFWPGNANGYIALAVGVALVLAVIALPRLERIFIVQAGERGEATLRLAVEGLHGALRRYEPLPALIAERPVLMRLLENPGNAALADQVNRQLRVTADDVQASDIYVMNETGLTLAASNYYKERTFIGRDFSFRPYFVQAMTGKLGRYFALGTTSRERGYFFAAPVARADRTLGVVAVKFTVGSFEDAWRGGESEILVTDDNGVIFMSSRSDWHFRTLEPLTPSALSSIERNRQYPLDRIAPLPNDTEALGAGLSTIRIRSAGDTQEFVSSTVAIAAAGWRVSILTPTENAKAQALTVLAVGILALLFAGLIAAVFLQRRARLVERLEAQRANQELLEKRVAERTVDLDAANRQLRQEVEERRLAEKRLRQTQAELVQAGKLAALGQMSAALSHEYNQPLAAVKSYAENAAAFLDRREPAKARDNIGHISKLADRMAAISKHLRNFARRPQDKVSEIALVTVIDEAIDLMAPRLKGCGGSISFDRPAGEIWARGGQVRLQQVLVNLFNNALDAMEAVDGPQIHVSVEPAGERWQIGVRDHGPGLAEDLLPAIFDPFFTTKAPGKGLGLGLSISYNIIKDFGGELRARNVEGGGALFIVELDAAPAPARKRPKASIPAQ